MKLETLKILIAALEDIEVTETAPRQAISGLLLTSELGRPIIVRSRDAGVLFGEYAGNDGSTVHLKNAVQMWRWKAKKGGTLIDCATFGVVSDFGKYSPAQATVTVFNACALIDCTDDAASSIRSVTAKDFS